MATDAAVKLTRPTCTQVAFDPKWTNTPEGWPTEALKAGSIEALVTYACYYSTRKRRPHMVPPGIKQSIDPDYCDLFWRTFSSFATADEVVTEIITLASKAVSERQLLYQVVDGLSYGCNIRHDYLGYLRPDQQSTIIAGARTAYYTLLSLPSLTQEESTALKELNDLLSEAELFVDGTASQGLLLGNTRRGAVSVQRLLVELSAAIQAGAEPEDIRLTEETPLSIVVASAPVYWPGTSFNSCAPFNLLVGSGIPASALAEAWALIDEALFSAIPPREWLACGWDKPRFEHAADGVRAFVDKYNASSLWVSSCIVLAGQDPPRPPGSSASTPPVQQQQQDSSLPPAIYAATQRAATITRLVQLANHLRRLNDFSGVSSIIMGLKREAVSRLAATWSLVPVAAVQRFQALSREVEDKEQYKKYKGILLSVPASHPAVPHLGAHTMEMTACEMNLPETLDLWRNGPKGLSFKRARELWRMASQLVSLQHPDRGYVSSGAIASVDTPLVSALLRSLAPFFLLQEDERDAVLERLDAQSQALMGEAGPIAAADKKSILERLIAAAQKERSAAEVAVRVAQAQAVAVAAALGAQSNVSAAASQSQQQRQHVHYQQSFQSQSQQESTYYEGDDDEEEEGGNEDEEEEYEEEAAGRYGRQQAYGRR